ncbi:MAG: hypothetical protein VX444_01085 [Pseudomonadota bacterium]|nr:hypothetical protein [Pseudomonadota bacterium]
MVQCMTPDQMQFFASLLGDIVSTVGENQNFVLINAEAGPVYWQYLENMYCMVKKVTL